MEKAEQYLDSASENLRNERLYPAAEEIFRAIETTLEALLYYYGIRKIEYHGTEKKFTGRLALQFLIRNNLVNKKRVSRNVYNKYLELATDLHLAGYTFGKSFIREDLEKHLEFAENLFYKAKGIVVSK
ncbi:MAG: HEPN domain-containing protein [Candidatus Methanofastidiosia archaeon]